MPAPSAARIAALSLVFSAGSRRASARIFSSVAACMIALRCFSQVIEPVTRSETFCSSVTFQEMNSSMSGWSRSSVTILAARRVVPPDLIAPAARSPTFRNDIRPDDVPPPESFSPSPRMCEKFDPVPEPYLKMRASRTHRSMIPPSLTRSSLTPWIKQAWGAGCSYAEVDCWSWPVLGSTNQWPWAGPAMPYAQCRPVLNHCGELGAPIWRASIAHISS